MSAKNKLGEAGTPILTVIINLCYHRHQDNSSFVSSAVSTPIQTLDARLPLGGRVILIKT